MAPENSFDRRGQLHSMLSVSFCYNSYEKSSLFVLEGNLLKVNVENTNKHVRRPGNLKQDVEFVQAAKSSVFCKTYEEPSRNHLTLSCYASKH
jgi:hypothetical protein